MKEQLKIEFGRAFRSRMLYITLLVGCIIAGAQFVVEVFPAAKNPLMFYSGKYDNYPITVFEKWIGGNVVSPYSMTYRTILPILSTLPYGLSYLVDVKSGYVKNVYSRTKRINYLLAKYIVTFITAGMVAVIPYILNLYGTAMVLPSLLPVHNGQFSIRAICMLEDVFYTRPYLYIALYLLIYFVYAGVFATIAMSVVYWVDNIFLVSLVPFIVYYMTRLISPYLRMVEWLGVVDITSILNMCQPTAVKWTAVIIVVIIVGGVSASLYFVNGVKKDAY